MLALRWRSNEQEEDSVVRTWRDRQGSNHVGLTGHKLDLAHDSVPHKDFGCF